MLRHFNLIIFFSLFTNLLLCHSTVAQLPVCSFSNSPQGTLIGEGKPLVNKLVSNSANGGVSATLSVICKEPVKLIVHTFPNQVEGKPFTPQSYEVILKSPSGVQTSVNSQPIEINLPGDSNGISSNLILDIVVYKGSKLIPGRYKYTVKIQTIRE